MYRAPLRFLQLSFMPLEPYPARYARHLPPREEGFIRRYSFSSYVCIRSDVMGKAVFSYRSLPRMGKGDRASGG